MLTFSELASKLHDVDFLPVVRTSSADSAVSIGRVLTGEGFGVLEITATIPNWTTAISKLRDAFPESAIGAGTVLTAEDARRALAAGADFLVSPGTFPAVIEQAQAAAAPFIPGALSPTEIFNASEYGLVKLFPSSLGGLSYLKAIMALAPAAGIIPTGGVTVSAIPEWKQAGALAVGMGVKSMEQAASILAELRVRA